MAPEMFSDAVYQFEVDVWATGITMLELFNMRLPFDHFEEALQWGAIRSLATDSEDMQRLALGLPGKTGITDLSKFDLDRQVYELAYRCLNTNQQERPTAVQLMELNIMQPYIAELRALDEGPCRACEKDYDGDEECRCRLTFAPLRELFKEVDQTTYQYHQGMKMPDKVARS